MPNQIQMRNCKSWVFSLMIRSHEANSQETAFEGRIWVWKIQVLVTSGEIIMQTFRDQTQKNVKMSFKELSHPPPEKCNSHVLAPPSNHFMQKTTCHYDDKVTKSCYWKILPKIFYFYKKNVVIQQWILWSLNCMEILELLDEFHFVSIFRHKNVFPI